MTKDKSEKNNSKSVTTNRRALSRYEIIETMEAGVVLTGPEVKSLRAGGANLQDGFIRVDGAQALLMNVHISPYAYGSLHVEQIPTRTRKLLMHQREILKWGSKVQIKGMTIVPLEIYFNSKGKAKVKIALAKGKNAPDQRDDLKKKTLQREMRREFSGKHRVR